MVLTNDNVDSEHLIPNALGGRKQIKWLICKPCNSNTGTYWDSKLVEQFEYMNVFFDIKRQRGHVKPAPVETMSGEKLKILPGGKYSKPAPIIKRTKTEDGLSFYVEANSEEEARKIAEGIIRKTPHKTASLGEFRNIDRRVEEPITFKICPGGLHSGRSIVKSIFMLALAQGVSPEACDLALDYLTKDGQPFYGDKNGGPCFGYFNQRELVTNRPDGVPLHCIYVEGNPETGLLAGYAEYFGFFKIVILLSQTYSGESFEASYAVDPRSGDSLDVKINFDLELSEILAAYEYKMITSEQQKKDLVAVFGPRHKEIMDKERDEFIREVCRQVSDELGIGENEPMTREKFDLFNNKVTWEVAKFMTERTMRNRRLAGGWFDRS